MTTPSTPLTISEAGDGAPTLILHGGGGPATVAGIAAHLAASSHTITPTHPGWNGTPRPGELTTVRGLARTYLDLLERRDLRDVLVVGSSIGGWIALELALLDTERRVSGLALIDAVGVEVEGEPIRDFFALDARGIAEYSFHDSERFYTDPSTIPPERVAQQRANMQTMRIFAVDPYMHDPTLLDRLPGITVPATVIWGASDRIVTPAYGRAIASALGNSRFALVEDAGHLPQLERPQVTHALLDDARATVG